MQKMILEYAEKLLNGGYVFGNRFISCHDDLLVVGYNDDNYPYRTYYNGTRLKDGKLQTDEDGFVVFTRVQPVINEHTRFE